MTFGVRVEGLAELRRALRQVDDPDALPELRLGLRAAAEVVARDAQGRIPSRTGRTRASVRAISGGNKAYVVGGKASVPWYGWLDFGKRTPRRGNPRAVGPWAGTGQGPRFGRFIYPAIESNDQLVARLIEEAIGRAFNRLGF